MDLCKSARAHAKQLEINHGVRVTGPFKEREALDSQARLPQFSSIMTTLITQEANGPIMTGCIFLDEDRPISLHLENGRLHDGAQAYSVVSCQVVCWSFRPGWTREVATEIGKALDVQYHEGVFSISGITEQNLERSVLRLVNAMLLFYGVMIGASRMMEELGVNKRIPQQRPPGSSLKPYRTIDEGDEA